MATIKAMRVVLSFDRTTTPPTIAGLASYTLQDATDPTYEKTGQVDVSDLLAPGTKRLATFRNEVIARVEEQ